MPIAKQAAATELPSTGIDGTDDKLTSVASQLHAVVAPLSRALRQDAPEPFSATQLSVLGCIKRHGPLNLRELAEREQLSAPMISKVVASLDGYGVIDRIQDHEDRRVCLVEVSSQGQDWIQRERGRRSAWLAGRLGTLSVDELATIEAALPVLRRVVGDRG